jgi:hypothetical protein
MKSEEEEQAMLARLAGNPRVATALPSSPLHVIGGVLVGIGVVAGLVVIVATGSFLLAFSVFSSFLLFALICALFAKLGRIEALLIRIRAEIAKSD